MARITLTKDLPYTGASGTGIVENFRIGFLHYLDRIYAPIAYFVLLVSLFIIVVFPLFFRINLDRPLSRLLSGVQQFRAGNLTIAVPIQYRDEIGYLTQSFNEMAEAQNELINNLEDKVEIRTVEATKYAAKNARLEERHHLSRELHDAVSQTLFSANLISDTLPEIWERDPEKAKIALAEMRQLNRDALSEMRQLLLELRPEKLSTSRFGTLLKDITKDVERKFKISISLQVEGNVILPEKVQLTYYRIAQECLVNAAKHAKATELQVSFDGVESQALMIVKDNGVGFDPDIVGVGHLGLQIMKERILEIGGTLEIDSGPGRGTTITTIWFEHANTE